MELTLPFNKLSKNDAAIAGGKGASLGEMTRVGIPVPPGFVILATAFEQFIKETDLVQEIDTIIDSVNHKEIHTVEVASEKIKNLILSREIPEYIKNEIQNLFKELNTTYVAVRSSATAEDGRDHAWAGQLDSYLNTTEADLLEKVKHCWTSLFTPRAIFYRFEKGLHTTKISVAVVVQKMVDSETSGIAFSVHPVTEDRNQLIIEAGFGLGEAIVSGQITPDSYVVEKNPRRILDINVYEQEKGLYRKENGGNGWKDLGEKGKTQVLSKEQILELSNIILDIENHYGFPCDIEWAYEAGKFYIIQSRPITTLSGTENKPINTLGFKKRGARDTALMVFQPTAETLDYFEKMFGKAPSVPMTIYRMQDGLTYMYDNNGALGWLAEQIYQKNISELDFFKEMMESYIIGLTGLESYYLKQTLETTNELEEFISKIKPLYIGFALMFFTASDPRIPKDMGDFAKRLRDEDKFFVSNDKVIRSTLQHLFPEIKGYEVAVLVEDLKNMPSSEILKARFANYVFAPGLKDGSMTTELFKTQHPEIKFIENTSLVEESIKTGEIKGNVAYKGLVTGPVKLITRKEFINTIQDGDVVVAHMTTPDFTAALAKAKAIITDEGGVTCHAAIISRELKIPCIIGTKVATQILKTGDMVEVDAENGIVKII